MTRQEQRSGFQTNAICRLIDDDPMMTLEDVKSILRADSVYQASTFYADWQHALSLAGYQD